MENEGKELDWSDSIENDGGDFSLIPAGTYPFSITGFERARHQGSEKLPPCNKAILSVRVHLPDGATQTVKSNLFLHTKTEGLICQFFRSIGHRKSGEKLVMDWGKVPGSKGVCKVSIRKFKKRDGGEGESNEVDFLDPGAAPGAATTAKAAGFTPGEF